MVGAWPLLIGGLSVHLHPFLPRSLLPCLTLWRGVGDMNLKRTLEASLLGSASSAAMWSYMQL